MLSCIIVNYKNEELTASYIKNELSKIIIPHKVVIVNNGATAESDNRLSELITDSTIVALNTDIKQSVEYGCFIIHNELNNGFAAGNNIGAYFSRDKLKSKYLLFTNNDIKFQSENIVETLISVLDDNQKIGLIGPRVIGKDGKDQSPEPYYSFFDNMIRKYFPLQERSKPSKIVTHRQEGMYYKVMGSFFLCKTSDYFECGLMDETTFLYYEECILSERMKKIGKTVYYCPRVTVLHDHGSTISKYSDFARQRNYMHASAAYYYKNYKNIHPLFITISTLLKDISIFVGRIKRLFLL